MEDINIMKIKKYVPGYNSDTRPVIEPSFIDVQTVVDYDSENFKYGLGYSENNGNHKYTKPLYFFQDPLFPIFDIILDTENSPLFINGTNGLDGFLQDYGGIYSIGARKRIHQEFKKTIFNLFNTEFKAIDRNKAYYVNSITGLDKMTARIVDFEKDKITINLNEDVSMMSAYLAHLYNNLSYSYRDQRQMIPANLLRFNMYIKIHDVRNMPFYLPNGTGTTTTFDKSYQIYLLRDCTFDFKKSKNFDDALTVNGFDAGVQIKPATINIDVNYKSIEIESEYPLIFDSFFDKQNTTLKLNNKDKDVLGYINPDLKYDLYGKNMVYLNNDKTPDFFDNELSIAAKANSDGTPSVLDVTNGILQNEAEKNYKYGMVSSGKERGPSIKEIPTKYDSEVNVSVGVDPTWKDNHNGLLLKRSDKIDDNPYHDENIKGESGDIIDTNNKFRRADKIENDTYYLNTDGQGFVVYDVDNREHRASEINHSGEGDYLYKPSVFDSDWNYSSDVDNPRNHPQTDPALNYWRDSIMGELNFKLGGFLLTLPLTVINMFLGGYHGMQTTYIEGSGSDVYYGHRGGGGNNSNINPLPTLDGDIIADSIIITGGVLSHTDLLNGEILTSTINTGNTLDGAIITSTPKPQQLLSGSIDTQFNLKDPLTGSIDTTYDTHIVELGSIDTTHDIKPLLFGYIDTTFKIHPSVSGVIDTTFKIHPPVDGVIDTSFKIHPPVDGSINTQFNLKEPLSGSIDTTIKLRVNDMGSLYTNIYENRNVDLGLLYIGVNNDNILPLTYLYAKVEKFNSLFNYHMYNNVNTESKPFDVRIDQTLKDLNPIELIYEYDNNIDITKTLNNINLYNNNIERGNNIDVMNVINTISQKKDMTEIRLDNTVNGISMDILYLYDKKINNNNLSGEYLYSDTNVNNNLNGETISIQNKTSIILNLGEIDTNLKERGSVRLGSLYEPSSIQRLVEPISLFEPVSNRKPIDLGTIYENNIQKDNILKSNIDNIPVNISKKTFEVNAIDQKIIQNEPMSEKYITSDIKDKTSLNGDTLSQEYKEKKGLDNERLR